MHVGVCRLMLHLPESLSLKAKRGVARSLASRIQNRFNVSVAEEADGNLWQRLALVVCCVSNDADQANRMLSSVVNFVEENQGELELLDYGTEIISGV